MNKEKLAKLKAQVMIGGKVGNICNCTIIIIIAVILRQLLISHTKLMFIYYIII